MGPAGGAPIPCLALLTEKYRTPSGSCRRRSKDTAQLATLLSRRRRQLCTLGRLALLLRLWLLTQSFRSAPLSSVGKQHRPHLHVCPPHLPAGLSQPRERPQELSLRVFLRTRIQTRTCTEHPRHLQCCSGCRGQHRTGLSRPHAATHSHMRTLCRKSGSYDQVRQGCSSQSQGATGSFRGVRL